jgi:GAF domain-containing protein
LARLDTVTALAKRLIPHCDAAGPALEVQGTTFSIGPTDGVVLQVDLVQYDTGEGPYLSAIERGRKVRIDVLDADQNWQHFACGAIEGGVHGVLSTPLHDRARTVGALNLYSFATNAFDEEAERTAEVLAEHAAEVLTKSRSTHIHWICWSTSSRRFPRVT